MPSLEDELEAIEWKLDRIQLGHNPTADVELLLTQRNNILANIHNTRTTR